MLRVFTDVLMCITSSIWSVWATDWMHWCSVVFNNNPKCVIFFIITTTMIFSPVNVPVCAYSRLSLSLFLSLSLSFSLSLSLSLFLSLSLYPCMSKCLFFKISIQSFQHTHPRNIWSCTPLRNFFFIVVSRILTITTKNTKQTCTSKEGDRCTGIDTGETKQKDSCLDILCLFLLRLQVRRCSWNRRRLLWVQKWRTWLPEKHRLQSVDAFL